jgi:hypothetical protein
MCFVENGGSLVAEHGRAGEIVRWECIQSFNSVNLTKEERLISGTDKL